MVNIIIPSCFDSSKISFESVKSLDSGGKSIAIRYESTPMILQTPEMVALFGSSSYKLDKDKPLDKKTLELSFKGAELKKNLQRFMDNMSAMDKKLVDEYFNKSHEWIRKKYNSVDVVQELYTPLVRYATDKETGEQSTKYAPTFRLNIPFKDNKLACDIYNAEKQLIQLCDIERGSKVTAIIQCNGIWIAAGKFGCSWRVVQLRVVPPQAISGFAFKDIDEDDHDGGDLESEHAEADAEDAGPSSPAPENSAAADELVESSSDEEEEEAEKKKVVKRVAKKKT